MGQDYVTFESEDDAWLWVHQNPLFIDLADEAELPIEQYIQDIEGDGLVGVKEREFWKP
jgi:hypothetical protein